jgi:hypothetical protein
MINNEIEVILRFFTGRVLFSISQSFVRVSGLKENPGKTLMP